MKETDNLADYAPVFERDQYTDLERAQLRHFFTNLDKPVYAPMILSPEVTGALCSRTSRAADDLRVIFLREYLRPFLEPERTEKDTEETWQQKQAYSDDLKHFIRFLGFHPIQRIFSNPRARSFYNTWLAQYGDDSIAQMAGMHLVYVGLSQVAIKHFEDQRIGLAPLEKSTRYVDYSQKVQGSYRYYTDPELKRIGLETEYRAAMDNLFETYTRLKEPLKNWLANRYPDEDVKVIQSKVFDCLRGLLPTATLSQVAFFGNGQAFEYMMARSLRHRLGEIRWAADQGYAELMQIAPSFLRRLRVEDPDKKARAQAYQEYLSRKNERMMPIVEEYLDATGIETGPDMPRVKLAEYDALGEEKILTGMLYGANNNHRSWNEIFEVVQRLSYPERREIMETYLGIRSDRWQKVGRAFENAYVRFEILMNIGAWRDVQRHRMLTQQRQLFTCKHGFDVPIELEEAGLADEFKQAVKQVEVVHYKIAKHDPELAQYAVTLAHRLRFMQWENLRQCFWEMELRTIPEGHPDYRHIEQEKFRQLQQVYPLVTRYMRVNMGEYEFARRGQEEKIQNKLKELERTNQ